VFIANTEQQRGQMLEAIGVGSVDDLFAGIPREQRARSFGLPPGRSEFEVRDHLRRLAEKNAVNLVSFLGAGFYDHFIPAAVDALVGRSEFYTAYTPYQPEISQGVLQALYEYQSCICRLTDMEVSNASLYDGGTALYEAAMTALRVTGREKIVLAGGVSPIYRNMIECYTANLAIDLDKDLSEGESVDHERLGDHVDGRTAAVIFQNPSFFGVVQDLAEAIKKVHQAGALSIVSFYPIAAGLIESPGSMGADIVTGEGQSLGIPLSFGGPYLGFMAARKKLVRKMPGRICGRTTDGDGRQGFVLTLQAREQHIRREKATSNICTNQTLCALRSLAYMTLLGREGLGELAGLCAAKATYAKQRLAEIPSVRIDMTLPTFNEFVVHLPRDAAAVVGDLIDKGFAAGFPLGRYYPSMQNDLLVAVTEKRTKEHIGALAEALEGVL